MVWSVVSARFLGRDVCPPWAARAAKASPRSRRGGGPGRWDGGRSVGWTWATPGDVGALLPSRSMGSSWHSGGCAVAREQNVQTSSRRRAMATKRLAGASLSLVFGWLEHGCGLLGRRPCRCVPGISISANAHVMMRHGSVCRPRNPHIPYAYRHDPHMAGSRSRGSAGGKNAPQRLSARRSLMAAVASLVCRLAHGRATAFLRLDSNPTTPLNPPHHMAGT